LENVVAINAFGNNTAAVTSDGEILCWGENYHNQCKVPKNLRAYVSAVMY
jgi:alpha-tubulin suppressor-like RCC1 family protein